tara:strand:+ start:208 stop:2949 length:2742 start_codon:yes stop_codon:yes gene_type:complete
MSVQLTVFPQYFDGSGPLSSPSTEFVVDGINFNAVNTSSSTQSIAGALPQTFINSNTLAGVTFLFVNTWYRFSGVASKVDESSGAINFSPDEGIIQRLSSLTFGATYDLTLDITANSTNLKVYQYKGNVLKSTHTITGTGLQTISFNAFSTADIIAIYSVNTTAIIGSITCGVSASTPSGVFTDLSNGQVICDLYEDEDIPLSLSVDDFKNVAEKVQSYSKAFNLPATKRNNQIFDNIFEVTRTDTGLNFNPYKKTKCILKQDGFLLFEGYLRLIDIQNKKGEISYNVNLYSEAVAFADVIDERTFSDLDFTELEHDYTRTQIKYSWNDGSAGQTTPITWSNASTSGYRTDFNTLKYPFVDWTHQILLGGTGTGTSATVGNPELPSLETAFRPFINIKYLIDRIFEATDFTYESAFFNTADFGNLFMDFNWGADNAPVVIDLTTYDLYWTQLDDFPPISVYAGTLFTNLVLRQWTFAGMVVGQVPPSYDLSTNIITATNDGEHYNVTGDYNIQNTSATDTIDVECQWIKNTSVVVTQTLTMPPSSTALFNFTFNEELMNGDTLQAQFKRVDPASANTIRMNETAMSFVAFNVNTEAMTSSTVLQTLRGELGQWDFLKGIMTMFNLITLPDGNNPSNILIVPYKDVFIPTATAGDTLADRGITHDWTEKIDVSEMKLTPLTELNKKTIFKFVEDDDDYAFNIYKNSVGHLYGSKKYDASGFTILAGEDEVIAEPFAATVVKPLMNQFADFVTPAVYSMTNDGTTEGFENSPRIMYNNGIKSTGASYYIPAQSGVTSANEVDFLQFSHLTDIPTVISNPPLPTNTRDFHFGECQLINVVGAPTPNNLFNLYWLPYYNELYNPDTRIMTIKVNLSPSDISTFKMYDTVFIKNRTFRVNKIDYKPNDLATVEFILIP